MKQLFLFILLFPICSHAQQWDEEQYRRIERSIQQPVLKGAAVNVTQYGAKPGASARKNQRAIQRTIDAVHRNGGGRVVIPGGQTFVTGALELRSGVELHLETDACLLFAFEPRLYPTRETAWEGCDCHNLSPCIYAHDAHDIAITGKGKVDGGGSRTQWWPWCGAERYGWKQGMVSQRNGARSRLLKGEQRVFGENDGLRPQLIGLLRCERIRVEGVTLANSPFWTLHPLLCQDVTVREVRFENEGPNGDGCDPESCRRVLIEDCYFNTGDDCIAIKSGRNAYGRLRGQASEDIIIRRCQMRNGHGGVVIGSEVSGGCRRVFAHDCTMDSPELERVLRIKTNSCRGGVVEQIQMRDIEVGVCREAVLKINLQYEPREDCDRGYPPLVREILMQDVHCRRSRYAVQLIGLDSVVGIRDVCVRGLCVDSTEQYVLRRGMMEGVAVPESNRQVGDGVESMPLSLRMALSELRRTPDPTLLDFAERPKWNYAVGLELEALLDVYLRYGDGQLLDYCHTYADSMLLAEGRIRGYRLEDFNLDNCRPGHFLARLAEVEERQKGNDSPLLPYIHTIFSQLAEQPRTVTDSIFWHKAIYAHQVWLDGIFMGLPFRLQTAPRFCTAKELAVVRRDAVRQVKATYRRTLDRATGLNRHAWDETHEMFWADGETGLSQHCWARAQGWFAMALLELVEELPAEEDALRGELLEVLRSVCQAVVQWQDKKTGVWWQVMDYPEREGNYLESTASCMFAYVLLKASRLGYIDAEMAEAGRRAYDGIVQEFVHREPDGSISLTSCCSVGGLGPGLSEKVKAAAPTVRENRRRDGSFAYYLSESVRDNDAKGIGPFLWASLEMESYKIKN